MNVYETTVSHVSEGRGNPDPYVLIETSQPSVITALRRAGRFEVVREDNTPGCPRLVLFRIPVADVNWAGLAKRRGTPRPHLRSLGAGSDVSVTPISDGVGEAQEASQGSDGTPVPPEALGDVSAVGTPSETDTA